jgi:phosphogluconate dehydratase
VRLDALAGQLEALVAETDWNTRPLAQADVSGNAYGWGRELFGLFRQYARTAEEGGSALL